MRAVVVVKSAAAVDLLLVHMLLLLLMVVVLLLWIMYNMLVGANAFDDGVRMPPYRGRRLIKI